MRCTSPRPAGVRHDGTLAWRRKDVNRCNVVYQMPCGKCIQCRLEYARNWAVRCVHEAKMYDNNSFITLTYSDENLESPWLIYEHFQLFMKRLREKNPGLEIPFKVTGEYGHETKRPHWHALLFNYRPSDLKAMFKNPNGDQTYSSAEIDKLWGYNDPIKLPSVIGQVDFQSAAYVMRYAAKKLVHGKDEDHAYKPISKGSSKYAIGKKFLEKYWKDIFFTGSVSLPGGVTCSIPRYYEKWLLEQHPRAWNTYVTRHKYRVQDRSIVTNHNEQIERRAINHLRLDQGKSLLITKEKTLEIITAERFNRLQKHLKGDT